MSEWKGDKIVKTKKSIEEKFPVTCEQFEILTEEMFELFKIKQEDYGPSNIGMGKTVMETDDDVRKSMIGLSVRMNDKIQRLLNLTFSNREPNNESIEDTLKDIANYAVMALIVKNKDWGK
jgi:hypothetical protein